MKIKRFFCTLLSMFLVVTMLPTTAFAARPTKTQEDALNWARAQVGQVLGSGQCVDLIMSYYRFLGRSPAVINGCDYAKSDALRFGWSQLYQAQPQPGDILVYEGGRLNPYGHVAIYESDYVHYHQNVTGETGVVQGTWHYKDGDPDYTNYWGVVRPAWPSASDPSDDEYGYRITLDANGGTVSPDHIFADYTYGENGDLPTPTRPGYSFYKWGVDKTVTYETISMGNTVSSNSVITRTYDHTLYAVWRPLRYTISFDAAGGAISQSSREILYGNTYGSLPTATRGGYKFLGWFASPSGGSQVTSSDTYSIAGNQTLYAHWEQAATAHMHSLTHTTAKAATQTAEGNIEYWFCSGCGKYYSDSAATTQITQAQTVLPKLSETTAKTHTIKFDAGEGVVSESQRTVPVGDNIGELPVPTRAGYRFLGWYILPTTASAKVTSDTPVNRVNLPDGCTLYAQWELTNSNNNNASSSNSSGTSSESGSSGHSTKISIISPLFDPETSSSNNRISMNDVLANAYYYDAVQWAIEKGITAGTGSNTFSPNAPCTRAQIVTFLWRAAGSPKASASSSFTDVLVGSYYYDAVLWAVEQGITSGTSATTFSPDTTCTRVQAVTFLYRYEKSPAVSGSNTFTDVDADAYYSNAIQWAVGKNVTAGTSGTTFSPSAICTRGQIVTFLYRDMA